MSLTELLAHRSNRCRLTAVLILASVLSCRPTAPAPDIVATTDLGEIRRVELDEYILSLPQPRRSPPAGQPLPEWRRQVLEELIAARALEAEAHSTGLADTPEGQALLTNQREAVLTQVMGTRLIEKRVKLTDDDLRAFYDAHPEEFSHPEQIRARNIYRRVARNASPEVWEAARQEIEGMLDEIRRGARFGDLARAHSDSETAPLEGLIGRLDRGKLDPTLEVILWSLDEGEVSEAIRTPVGFHIFKVEKRLGRFKMEFEDARTRLRRRLTREATEAAEQVILQELLEASEATYEPGALRDGAPDQVLFALGDDSVTVADFYERLDAIGFFAARDLPLRRQLDRAVRERLYLWKAQESGLAGEPAIAAQLGQVEREALIALALRQRGHATVDELDERELREFYASREARFRTPRLLRIRILTRDFAQDGSWYAVYEELDRLAVEIRADRVDFAQAARDLSTDHSAHRGGDVGAIRLDAFAEWAGPQAQRKVLALMVGELSDPILIERYNGNRLTYDRAGYMLVRLEAIEEPRTQPFDEVRERVVEQYKEHYDQDIMGQTRQDILRSVGAVIFPEHL